MKQLGISPQVCSVFARLLKSWQNKTALHKAEFYCIDFGGDGFPVALQCGQPSHLNRPGYHPDVESKITTRGFPPSLLTRGFGVVGDFPSGAEFSAIGAWYLPVYLEYLAFGSGVLLDDIAVDRGLLDE